MKNLFTIILLLILLTVPVRTSHALFGQKQARYEAELQAAQAKAELKKVKSEADEAVTKANEERHQRDRTFGVIILLLAGSLVHALTHRKTVHQTVQQVVNVQAAHKIVAKTVVIDGTNVVRYGEGDCTSLLRLLGIVMELEKKKITYKCYFDASTFYVLRDCGLNHQAWAYRDLLRRYPTIFIQVPSGTQADDAILDYAHCHGTPIISNDQFREYKESYPWLENASRWRVPFVVHPTMVQLHRLDMQVNIPVSLNTAIREFDDLLKMVPPASQPDVTTVQSALLQPA